MKWSKLTMTCCVIDAADVPIRVTYKTTYASGYYTTETVDATWSGTQYSSYQISIVSGDL